MKRSEMLIIKASVFILNMALDLVLVQWSGRPGRLGWLSHRILSQWGNDHRTEGLLEASGL